MNTRRCVLPSLAGVTTTVLWLAAPVHSQIVFQPPTVVPTAKTTQGVLAFDLNLDGHEDVITLPGSSPTPHDSAFSVFLGHGDGTFTNSGGWLINEDAAGPGTAALLNGDALPDLVFVAQAYKFSSYSTLVVYTSTAGGNFSVKNVGTAANATYLDVRAVDVTGDGRPDLVVLDEGSALGPSALRTFVSNGMGGYTSGNSVALSPYANYFDLGDLNGDALPDAVVVTFGGDLDVVPGLAAGGFAPPSTTKLGGVYRDLVLHDLDGDGALDLALSRNSGVITLLGDGQGHFTLQQSLALGGAKALAVESLDADGVPDLLVSCPTDVAVLRGAGDGSFSFVTAVSNVAAPAGIAFADFDEDGRTDAAVGEATSGSGAFALLSNASYPAGSPFTDLGQGLPGSHGFPVQVAKGTLQPGTPVTFTQLNAPALSTSVLVLGLSQLDAPFKNGTLVPLPDVLISGLPIAADGSVALMGAWPPGVPSGLGFYSQFWNVDPAAPTHLSASSGLRVTTP